jgi:hypothetical protein
VFRTFSLVFALGLLVVAAAGIDWFFGQRMIQSVGGVVSGVKPETSRTDTAEVQENVPQAEEIGEAAAPQALSISAAPHKPKIQISEADLPAPPQPAAVRALGEPTEYAQDPAARLQALRTTPEPSPLPAVVPIPDPTPSESQEQTPPVEVAIPAEGSPNPVAPVISPHPELKPRPEPAIHPSLPHDTRAVTPRPTRVASTRDSAGRDIGARGPARAEPPPQNIIEREFQRWRRCDGKWGKSADCLAYEHNTGGG